MSIEPADLIAALAEAVSSIARMEAKLEEMTGEVQAAADRAENAAERATAQVDATRQVVERVLAARLDRFSEAARRLDEAQQELRQVARQRRLRWTVEIPNLNWLTAAVVAGMAVMVGAEIALAPLMFPPAAPAATAGPTAREAPQAVPRDRSHTR